jgi:hypothetical protein
LGQDPTLALGPLSSHLRPVDHVAQPLEVHAKLAQHLIKIVISDHPKHRTNEAENADDTLGQDYTAKLREHIDKLKSNPTQPVAKTRYGGTMRSIRNLSRADFEHWYKEWRKP